MIIAVLSGKGGAGKTFVSTNLAQVAPNVTYLDCDVEEPNGRLFLKPVDTTETKVFTHLPAIDSEKCIGCRACVDFCHFNAPTFIIDKPLLLPELCHFCTGCSLVCPEEAISATKKEVGVVEQGQSKEVRVVTGCMNLGEASGIPIIKETLSYCAPPSNTTIIDCPPGSACSVMESIEGADICIIVVEPTAFGFHNFKMVFELTNLLEKPCGIVINKADETYESLETFCQEHNIDVLGRIAFTQEIAHLGAQGLIASHHNKAVFSQFSAIYQAIVELV